ncbi:hypothetical protein NPX13_g19 [Xylaria arbuscula]|uniref:C2H2-type domain-containing protein n=1 Tax=Xylaria arbuscula TaxID=114810 RepID=A0A9W8TQX2_9PEZI|nr:hypothetical protein NPX13_g19 [Xylaria arbuscula]
MGVLTSGRHSLDYRLRIAPEVRDTCAAMLEAIEYRITSCIATLSFLRPQAINDLSPVDHESEKAIFEIGKQITIIHKLSNIIRRASKDLQDVQAAATFRICDDDDGNNADRALQEVFQRYIRDRFPESTESISNRLARAMVLRVDASSRTQDQPTPAMPGEAQPPKHSLGKSIALTTTTLAPVNYQKAAAASVVSGSKTIALDSHGKLSFPPAPVAAIRKKLKQLTEQSETQRQCPSQQTALFHDGDMEFSRSPTGTHDKNDEYWQAAIDAVPKVVCPFCYQIVVTSRILRSLHNSKDAPMTQMLLAADIVEENNAHVIADLEVYVCLFEDCESPEKLYSHSSQWLKHMQEHTLHWLCTSKDHGKYYSKEQYIAHLKNEHPMNLNGAQLSLIADKNARYKSQLFQSCPLCGATLDYLGSHIIGHLRQLALKFCPKYEDCNDELPGSSSTISVEPRTRSAIQDFETTDLPTDELGWTRIATSFEPSYRRRIFEEDPQVEEENMVDRHDDSYGVSSEISGTGPTGQTKRPPASPESLTDNSIHDYMRIYKAAEGDDSKIREI